MEAAVLKKRGWLVEIGKNLEKYREQWVEIGVMVYRPRLQESDFESLRFESWLCHFIVCYKLLKLSEP